MFLQCSVWIWLHYRQVECFTLHLMNVQKCLFVCVSKPCRSPQNMLSNADLTMMGFWTSEWQSMRRYCKHAECFVRSNKQRRTRVLEDWGMIHMACLMCVIGSCINVCLCVWWSLFPGLVLFSPTGKLLNLFTYREEGDEGQNFFSSVRFAEITSSMILLAGEKCDYLKWIYEKKSHLKNNPGFTESELSTDVSSLIRSSHAGQQVLKVTILEFPACNNVRSQRRSLLQKCFSHLVFLYCFKSNYLKIILSRSIYKIKLHKKLYFVF